MQVETHVLADSRADLRAVDLDVDRRAGARLAELLLVDDFFADAFFVNLDLGGLA